MKHKKETRQPKKQVSKKTSQHEEGIYLINKDKLSIRTGTGAEKQTIRQTSKCKKTSQHKEGIYLFNKDKLLIGTETEKNSRFTNRRVVNDK